ncbi:pre-mRNA-splicing factor 38B-like [Patiria miniata]|uniref:Pre-mRNA-splicing factor 38 n=1 Tax=Patiria miniata TaxID=46514 RepID=A0A914AK13_PATMI|nr:pre-mRNA-splicing factor 38B-like [Patiria miniata]XP_038064073.1 pre-mRNA-splicing factor 38B-like [Patiria miniata]
MPQKSNTLPTWGNEASMNLNPLILTNIQSSPYFKNELFKLKTYHEVVDEIFYRVDHLEPWERGSRQTSGQIGMCGGVRGVGAGGIVSSAYCLLYKLYTLKLTRKQLNGLLTHSDSPYIRGLGFMFIRYSQPPADLWDWLEPYLEDEEEIDCKAGSGSVMTIGEMVRSFLTKLEWFSTLFPRIPVPIMKDLEVKLEGWKVGFLERQRERQIEEGLADNAVPETQPGGSDGEKYQRNRDKTRSRSRERHRSRSKERHRSHSRNDRHKRSRSRERRRRSRSPERRHRRSRDRSRERRRSRSRDRRRDRDGDDFSRALQRERERQQKERRERRSSSREKRHSRDRDRKSDRDRRRSRSPDRKKKSHSTDKDRRKSRSPSQERR